MSDDLVERVALRDKAVLRYQLNKHAYRDVVAAAIAVALEEAARVVDSMAEDLAREFEPSPSIAWVRKNAAAIRAMTPQENTND